MSITLSKMAQSYKVIKTNSDISCKEVLPPSLRKILKQCARNGRCNWLEWQTAEEKQHFTQKRNGKRKRPDSSGEKSGSELEAGSIQYECDSEGTSTTNSELSRDKKIRQIQQGTKNATQPSAHQKYTSLRLAFSKAIRFSLDQFYNHRGGYKLSPLEEQSSPEIMFKKRRQKILDLCIKRNNPPFTLQRLAEVLLTPHKFYQQTHKLCNCLEKLLMVTSSIDAYGGSTGGASAQSLREEAEIAALTLERERQELEHRNRRFLSRFSPESSPERHSIHLSHLHRSPIEADNGKYSIEQPASWERSAKASLSHRFEHGSDGTTTLEHIRSMRSLSNSPPPPSGTDMSGGGTATHAAVASFFRQLNEDSDRHSIRKTTSQTSETMDPNNQQSIQYLAVSPDKNALSPLDIVIDRQLAESNLTHAAVKYLEGDAEIDRSSASNSDVDSESDDFSLDDSASDRSDGSDYEPFSAARVIALNRMQQQQQQRLQQIRVQSLGQLRPHGEMEYQSGDSMDSTMAEDSGGSDSSSSDLAD